MKGPKRKEMPTFFSFNIYFIFNLYNFDRKCFFEETHISYLRFNHTKTSKYLFMISHVYPFRPATFSVFWILAPEESSLTPFM